MLVPFHVFLWAHVVRGNPHRTVPLGILFFCHCRKSCWIAPSDSTETMTPRIQTQVRFTFSFCSRHSPWRHTEQARPSIPERGALAGAPARSQDPRALPPHCVCPCEVPSPAPSLHFPRGKGRAELVAVTGHPLPALSLSAIHKRCRHNKRFCCSESENQGISKGAPCVLLPFQTSPWSPGPECPGQPLPPTPHPTPL